MTEEAQLNKPKLQRWLDEFGERYSKVVVVLSITVAVIGPFLFKWPFISTSGTLLKISNLLLQSFHERIVFWSFPFQLH